MTKNIKDWALAALVMLLLGFIIWAFRMAPYGNDPKCLIAECRINK